MLLGRAFFLAPMKTLMVPTLGILFLALAVPVSTQSQTENNSSAELNALVARIQAKIRAGSTNSAEFASEVADFAALRTNSAGQEPEVAARILVHAYTFQRDVLKDGRAAMELRKELETKYRKFLAGTSLGRELEMQERATQVKATQANLVGKPAPELSFIWSTREGLTKLSALRGKVVVLDF